MKKLRRWIEIMCDPNYEPVWQEPLEWIAIGFLVAEVLFLGIM